MTPFENHFIYLFRTVLGLPLIVKSQAHSSCVCGLFIVGHLLLWCMHSRA